jgi:hypothetical protein
MKRPGPRRFRPGRKHSRKKVMPHILRHSHVVNALMVGVPVPMIQKPGGAQEVIHDGDQRQQRHRDTGTGEGGV